MNKVMTPELNKSKIERNTSRDLENIKVIKTQKVPRFCRHVSERDRKNRCSCPLGCYAMEALLHFYMRQLKSNRAVCKPALYVALGQILQYPWRTEAALPQAWGSLRNKASHQSKKQCHQYACHCIPPSTFALCNLPSTMWITNTVSEK